MRFSVIALVLLAASGAAAQEASDCPAIRHAVAQVGSRQLAEQIARKFGAPEEDIRRWRLCLRHHWVRR